MFLFSRALIFIEVVLLYEKGNTNEVCKNLIMVGRARKVVAMRLRSVRSTRQETGDKVLGLLRNKK
jgi:hypothetical protein